MNCEHCNRILGSLSSLNYHKLHNKKCIEKQGVTNNIFSCSLCQKIFTSKDNLNKHICIKKNEIYLEYEEYNKKNNMEIEKQRMEIEKQRIEIETQRIENETQRIENETQRIENETQRIENEKQRNIVNLENEVNLQSKNKKLKTYKKELETCKKELETCKKELETYRNIVNLEKEVQRKEIDYLYTRIEKLDKTMSDALLQSVNKPTISNTNHNNFNLIPLDIGHRNNIKDIVENHYNLEYQINGQKGLAKLLADSGVLKPKGENIYVCSDSSRGIFKYKNENGIEIRDIQAKDLTSWVQNIAIKNIKKEGLQRVYDLFECICSSETTETAQPFATEQSKLIEAHTSIVNMNDDNKEFVRALGVCI